MQQTNLPQVPNAFVIVNRLQCDRNMGVFPSRTQADAELYLWCQRSLERGYTEGPLGPGHLIAPNGHAMHLQVCKQLKPTAASIQETYLADDIPPGLCLSCGAEVWDGVEPDARAYYCPECDLPGVYGLEDLMIGLCD